MRNKSELDKVHDLIDKVHQMAQRGADGERQVAEHKLQKLLDKYKIRLVDIENQKKSKKTFRIANKTDGLTLMCQTIWDVAPKVKIHQGTRKFEVYVNLTNEEYIDVCEKYEYYWQLWCVQKDQFLTAFVIKNHLGTLHESTGIKKDDTTIKGIRSKIQGVAKGEYVNRKTKQLN